MFPPPVGSAVSPIADPPAAVPLEGWPLLSDRGDGIGGSPVDHELISFPEGIINGLKSAGDVGLDISAAAVGGSGGGGGGGGGDDGRRLSTASSLASDTEDLLMDFSQQDQQPQREMDEG